MGLAVTADAAIIVANAISILAFITGVARRNVTATEQRRVAVQRPRESLDMDMPSPREQNKLWHVLPRLVVIGLHIYFKVEGRNVPVMVISLCAQLLKSDAVTSPQDCCAVRGLCGS